MNEPKTHDQIVAEAKAAEEEAAKTQQGAATVDASVEAAAPATPETEVEEEAATPDTEESGGAKSPPDEGTQEHGLTTDPPPAEEPTPDAEAGESDIAEVTTDEEPDQEEIRDEQSVGQPTLVQGAPNVAGVVTETSEDRSVDEMEIARNRQEEQADKEAVEGSGRGAPTPEVRDVEDQPSYHVQISRAGRNEILAICGEIRGCAERGQLMRGRDWWAAKLNRIVEIVGVD